METRRRRNTFNIIMVALIAVIALCGIMAVGMVKGWFGGNSDSDIITGTITGIANIERDGVGYSLSDDTPLKQGDIIETKAGAEAELVITKDNQLTLNENVELEIKSAEKDSISLALTEGELFADVPDAGEDFTVAFGGNTAHITGTVFSASAVMGSASLNVYEGSVTVDAEDGSTKEVKAGECIVIAYSGDGKLTAEVTDVQANSLSNFLLEKAIACDSADKLCFTADKLQKLLDERNTEKLAAKEGTSESTIKADGEDSTSSSAQKNTSGNSDKNSSSSGSSSSDVNTCTIAIRCKTILNNMGDLTPGKESYVPSNGIILAASTVEFKDGETVFDVLKRVCNYTGIQLEYSWTPMYDSYYIEGINHLYEFDCGSESGWMYKVNGWFPNYGCSSYTLKDGDNIVWDYTCKGLGADVGGGVY